MRFFSWFSFSGRTFNKNNGGQKIRFRRRTNNISARKNICFCFQKNTEGDQSASSEKLLGRNLMKSFIGSWFEWWTAQASNFYVILETLPANYAFVENSSRSLSLVSTIAPNDSHVDYHFTANSFLLVAHFNDSLFVALPRVCAERSNEKRIIVTNSSFTIHESSELPSRLVERNNNDREDEVLRQNMYNDDKQFS